MAVCITIPLGTEVGVSLGEIVLDGNPAPPPLKGHSPQFLANVRCVQTAGWTKMPLGMDVGLGPGTLCSMTTQLPQRKGHSPHPIFDPCLLRSNGWMDQDATWNGSRPRPRPHCVRRGPSSTRERGTAASPYNAYVYCGHGLPSQLLFVIRTFCSRMRACTGITAEDFRVIFEISQLMY